MANPLTDFEIDRRTALLYLNSALGRMPVLSAWVAKLVDAPDSKSGSFTGVSVRVRPQVPLDTRFSDISIGQAHRTKR